MEQQFISQLLSDRRRASLGFDLPVTGLIKTTQEFVKPVARIKADDNSTLLAVNLPNNECSVSEQNQLCTGNLLEVNRSDAPNFQTSYADCGSKNFSAVLYKVSINIINKQQKFIEDLNEQNNHIRQREQQKLSTVVMKMVTGLKDELILETLDERSVSDNSSEVYQFISFKNQSFQNIDAAVVNSMPNTATKQFFSVSDNFLKKSKLDVVEEEPNENNLGDNLDYVTLQKSHSSRSISIRRKESQLDEIGEQVKRHLINRQGLKKNRVKNYGPRKQSQIHMIQSREQFKGPQLRPKPVSQLNVRPAQQFIEQISEEISSVSSRKSLIQLYIEDLDQSKITPSSAEASRYPLENIIQQIELQLIDNQMQSSPDLNGEIILQVPLKKFTGLRTVVQQQNETQFRLNALSNLKKSVLTCSMATNKGNKQVKVSMKKKVITFTEIESRPKRFLCFSKSPWSMAVNLNHCKTLQFSSDTLACWRCVQVQTAKGVLELSFSNETVMTEFMVAVDYLTKQELAKDVQTECLSQRHVLAKVLSSKLQFIAKKQYGMTSVPMILVIGMLTALHSLRSYQMNFKNRIYRLMTLLKRIGKKEVMKGAISMKDFKVITARLKKENIQRVQPPVSYETKELRVGGSRQPQLANKRVLLDIESLDLGPESAESSASVSNSASSI